MSHRRAVPPADALDDVLRWYDRHHRDLPWRAAGTSPWGVLVSEVMLQQTPVARVLPVWEAWLERWPQPADLAAEAPGEAVRAWGRLGYPRRALRLHAAAAALVADHGGRVPDDEAVLRTLPGVGDYTAAAVAAFAFGRRTVVLDTNVRRVLGRWRDGEGLPARAVTAAERRGADALWPDDGPTAARWSVALMELGALLCRAAGADCGPCPLRASCGWRAAGYPEADASRRRTQAWHGTDRQCRGALLAVLRGTVGAVPGARLREAWDDEAQRERALDSLVADGLVEPMPRRRYRLPG
jgi:A/G-specific adenine glycosylase